MGSVTVDGNAYEVYGDLAGATLYIAGLMTAAGVAWRALASNEKQRAILMARMLLDRQDWQGAATHAGTTLEWPRTGVVDRDGVAVSSATVPTAVVSAEYELAAIFASNPAFYEAQDSGSNVKRVQAKVEVEFFKPTSGPGGDATYFPKQVMDLVGQFLDSASGVTRSAVFGSDGDSRFTDCDRYTRSGAF